MSQKENDHMILDLETLALVPQATIVSIGALMFNPRSLKTIDMREKLLIVIDPHAENDKWVRAIDWATLKWHFNLPQGTNDYLNDQPNVSLHSALSQLSEYIHRQNPATIWANGITPLDFGVLYNAYNHTGLPIPWKHNQIRDARTIYQTLGMNKIDWDNAEKAAGEGDRHNPVHDCEIEIMLLKHCYGLLGKSK